MQIWHQFPFVRILAPFLAGTIAAISIQAELTFLPVISGALFFIYLTLTVLLREKMTYRNRWVTGLLINLLLLVLGYQLAIERTPAFNPANISNQLPLEDVVVKITEPIVEKENSYKIIARAMGAGTDSGFKQVEGKLMFYFQKDPSVEQLKYGDLLIIRAKLQEVPAPTNPGQFNYHRYLFNRGIYLQAYVRKGNWSKMGSGFGNRLKAMGISLRERFLEILMENHLTGRKYAVAAAILLGYDEYLDADQKRQFAGAGAMHILCVSGLHVGIIYIILNSLLSFMSRRKYLRTLKVLLLLMLIWFYALITGFSPSVMRAATMFSFIIIGQSLRRKSNIYNSLAASAFLLIVIDPYIITAVGFQLSYLAVFGIVTLFKPIYNLYIPGNWLTEQVWSLSVVSIAATLITFPLSVFYFHQFPNLFLITNLVAIPASMLILYAGILVLLTSPVPFISNLIAGFLAGVIQVLNTSVGWIEALPFATSSDLYVTFPETILIFVLIMAVLAALILKNGRFAVLATIAAVLISGSFTLRKIQHMQQTNMIVFNIRNHTAIGFLEGNKEYLIADSLLICDSRKLDFHVRSHWVEDGIRDPVFIEIRNDIHDSPMIWKKGSFIQTPQVRVLIVDPYTKLYEAQQKINVDLVIYSANPSVEIKQLLANVDCRFIIFDSSCAPWNIKRWSEACREQGVAFYNVAQKGAWIASQ